MTTTIYAAAASRASLNKARPVSSGRPPADFDPAAYPILATHFFDIEPIRPIGEIAAEVVASLRFRQQVEHLYRLGPRAIGELLREVADDENLGNALAAYQRLTPDVIKALGGDRGPPRPIHEVRK